MHRISAIRVLDHDPDLGHGLSPEAFQHARRHALARAVVVAPGVWDPAAEEAQGRSPFAALVLAGAIARQVSVGSGDSVAILGPGCVLLAWEPGYRDMLGSLCTWRALERTRLAILEAPFEAAAAHWPALTRRLFSRVADQAHRVQVSDAIGHLPRIEDRIVALLWHLTDRWGRVTPDGVVLPLRLTHQMLGSMTGARRPTVSLALKELADEGAVLARAGGGWLLPLSPPEHLRAAGAPADVDVEVLGGQAQPAPLPADAGARPARSAALARLRVSWRDQQQLLDELQQRTALTRARSHEIVAAAAEMAAQAEERRLARTDAPARGRPEG